MNALRPLLLPVVPVLLSGCADVPMSPDARSFDWLAGCWQATLDDGSYAEMWLPPGPDGTIGAARRVKDGRTRASSMRIEIAPGSVLVLHAHPEGGPQVDAPLVEHGQGRLVFQSDAARVEYRLVDVNALTRRSQLQGGESADYALRRIACET